VSKGNNLSAANILNSLLKEINYLYEMRCILLKVLHTADIHLSPAAPERMEALRSVCHLSQELGCAALLIAGDLFDTPKAAMDLRAEVRELFDSCPAPPCAAGRGRLLLPSVLLLERLCGGLHRTARVE
jgi:predicted MPP superfamily phosphohydrolase